MPQLSIQVDLADHKDVAYAAAFLAAIHADSTAAEAARQVANAEGPKKDALMEAIAVGPTNPAAAASPDTSGLPDLSGAAAAGSTSSTSTTAPSAASPSEPVGTTRKRSSKKPPEDIVLFNPAGEKLHGFTHSADAADAFVVHWERLTTIADLSAFRDANLNSLARLAKEDLERIQPKLAAHSEKVKKGEVAPPPATVADPLAGLDLSAQASAGATAVAGLAPPATAETAAPSSGDTEAELSALFSGGPAPAAAMTKEEYQKGMVTIARALGPQESAAWLAKAGYTAVMAVPDDKWAAVIAAGNAHIQSLAAKTA